METYQAFGLALESELSLPCIRSSGTGNADVEIVFGAVEAKGLESPIESGPYSQSKPGLVWLRIPGAGRFLISGGARVLIDPDPGADEQSLRLFVSGYCLGAILHQRGFLVLHGSAVRFGDQCVVFAGDSGTGKSATAAALRLRGHDVLADDMSVIDDMGHVRPGFPEMKLRGDTARHLGLDTAALARIRPQADKYACPLEQGFCEAPMALAAVFVLGIHEKRDVLFETIHGMDKMRLLNQHTYRAEHVRGMGLQRRHLMQCSRLAGGVNMACITRPASGLSLDAWLERLDTHLPGVPAG